MSWMEESPVTAHKVDIKLSRGRRNQGKKMLTILVVFALLLAYYWARARMLNMQCVELSESITRALWSNYPNRYFTMGKILQMYSCAQGISTGIRKLITGDGTKQGLKAKEKGPKRKKNHGTTNLKVTHAKINKDVGSQNSQVPRHHEFLGSNYPKSFHELYAYISVTLRHEMTLPREK